MAIRARRMHEVMRELALEPLREQRQQAPRVHQRPRQRDPAQRDAQSLRRRAVQGFRIVEVGDEARRLAAAEALEPLGPAIAGIAEQGEVAQRGQRRPTHALDQGRACGRRDPVVEQVLGLQSGPVARTEAQRGVDRLAREVDQRGAALQVDLDLRMRGDEARAGAAPASSTRTKASGSGSAPRRAARSRVAAPARWRRGAARCGRTGARHRA